MACTAHRPHHTSRHRPRCRRGYGTSTTADLTLEWPDFLTGDPRGAETGWSPDHPLTENHVVLGEDC
ncbi:hypothetical protein OG259_39555 [Streptomyces sp. NBC_00250]|uniref:hypothetical protein n=1 Tax=Streptomyces sp. NBC_00250 TaxID=2903641 RepID=UPI002E2AEAD2|nr:hypothetical protein [Streptomyces sp. NBC_00250]